MLNRKFVIILYSVIFIIIIIYTLIKIRPIISGPNILINQSTLIASTTATIQNISGTTINSKSTKIFDKELSTDKDGNWNTDVLLYNDHNLVRMSAEDNYGKVIRKEFYILRR